MTRGEEARAAAVEWDEFGQAYDASGKVAICVCGHPFPGYDHYCPYDEPAKRVYVAGSRHDIERVNSVQALVRDVGWEIVFDWTGAEGEVRTDASWDAAPEKGAAIALHEIEAAKSAELLILVFPQTRNGLGCWIEMGATLASGGEVWVVEPGRDSVFWQHPRVRRFSCLESLEAAVRGPTSERTVG